MSSNSDFESVLSLDTLNNFGFNMKEWTAEDQILLRETMILAWKETPDWNKGEATAHCRLEVKKILEGKFREEYYPLISEVDSWIGFVEAFTLFQRKGRKALNEFLADRLRYKEFCRRFYDDLRELYNIDSEGMDEQYKMMKEKDWDFGVYHEYLENQKYPICGHCKTEASSMPNSMTQEGRLCADCYWDLKKEVRFHRHA
jgi:hypothetical protein